MEIYFNRPRLRRHRTSYVDPSRKDWLYFHDHDLYLTNRNHKTLYLYRSPTDTIFSLLSYNITAHRTKQSIIDMSHLKSIREVEKHHVQAISSVYHDHLFYYLIRPGYAQKFIRYEKLIDDSSDEFNKIAEFFNIPYDQTRFLKTKAQITKKKVLEAGERRGGDHGMRSDMLKNKYNEDRQNFVEKWGSLINEIVLTDRINDFF